LAAIGGIGLAKPKVKEPTTPKFKNTVTDHGKKGILHQEIISTYPSKKNYSDLTSSSNFHFPAQHAACGDICNIDISAKFRSWFRTWKIQIIRQFASWKGKVGSQKSKTGKVGLQKNIRAEREKFRLFPLSQTVYTRLQSWAGKSQISAQQQERSLLR